MQQLYARLKRFFEGANIFLQPIAALSIIFAVLSYYEDHDDRNNRGYSAAWNAITSASGSTSDGGRRKALEYLQSNRQSLQGATLSDALLSYINLYNTDLNRSEMENADLFGADLRAASLWGAYMKNANLQFAQMQGANLFDTDLRCADMRGANLGPLDRLTNKIIPPEHMSDNAPSLWDKIKHELDLGQSFMAPTSLEKAKLKGAHIEGADLQGANMKGAQLQNAHLSKYKNEFKAELPCKRDSSGLIGMEKKVPNSADRNRPPSVCKWVEGHSAPDRNIELPKSFSCDSKEPTTEPPAANLTKANLTEANLTEANLTEANLTEANLTRANLIGTVLKDANLTGAVGITEGQIEAAKCLCNTTLPRDIDGIKNRDCNAPRLCEETPSMTEQ